MDIFILNPEQSFDEFVKRVLLTLGIKVKKLPNLNQDFDNLIYHSSSEILIKNLSSHKYQFIINPIRKVADIRFGCELELCFDLNCADLSAQLSFEDNMIQYLRKYLIPKFNSKFISKFGKAYISGYHSKTGILIDMKTGNILSENHPFEGYNYLIFSPDQSIKCYLTETFSCEIISPILKNISDLKLIYQNLIETCVFTNSTTGFHVNLSGMDKSGKQTKITYSALEYLIEKWIQYESVNYALVRDKYSPYAAPLEDVLDDYRLYQSVSSLTGIKNHQYYQRYGIGDWVLAGMINQYKMFSLTNYKHNDVLEIRMFQSKEDIDTLLEYTKQTIEWFKLSMKEYYSKAKNIIHKIQYFWNHSSYPDVPNKFKLDIKYDTEFILNNILRGKMITTLDIDDQEYTIFKLGDNYFLYQSKDIDGLLYLSKPRKIKNPEVIAKLMK